MVRHRVEWIGSGMDGLMRSSKGQVRRGMCEMSSSEKKKEESREREDRERDGWPDAKFDGRRAKCDLRIDQQRVKREESRERREKREESREG